MIVCPKCGEELEDGTVFCTTCGTQISIKKVKDDVSLKAECAKLIHGEVNLGEWSIASEKTNESEMFCVQIEQNNLHIYTKICLKKDANFYFRIVHFIENCEKTMKSDFYKTEVLKKQIESTIVSLNGDTVQFGKYRWNVVRKYKTEALLLCEYALKKCNDYASFDARKWLNDIFLKDAFSVADRLCLKTNSSGDKVFFLSKEHVMYFERQSDRVKHTMTSENYVSWWLSDGNCVISNGRCGYSSTTGNEFYIVPAILVSLE